MIADALHAEIIAYAARVRCINPLFCKAQDGTLTSDEVAHYLANMLHLLRHTPVFLEHARERAIHAGDTRLAKYFVHKAIEEDGHDRWAEQDLALVSLRASSVKWPIVPAIEDLMAFTIDISDEDPSLILSYMFFAESLTVIVGGEWLKLLEERCAIPRSSMTMVDNHVELDRDHMDEALSCIDELVGDPQKLPRMHGVLLESSKIFDRFCSQIVEAGDARARARDIVHAPAA